MIDQKLQDRINSRLENGYNFKVRTALDKAGTIFKELALYVILAGVFYSIFYVLGEFLGNLFYKPNQEELESMMGSSDYNELIEWYKTEFGKTEFKVLYIYKLLLNGLIAPIGYSVYHMCRKYDLKQNVEISDIFIMYKNGRLGKLFLATILLNIFFMIGFTLCFFPGIIVMIMLTFVIPLIIFGNVGVGESINLSIKLTSKNFLGFFKLILVLIGVCILGFLACCIGIIVAYPFCFVLIYIIYKEVAGFDNEQSEIDQIGTDIYKDNPYMK